MAIKTKLRTTMISGTMPTDAESAAPSTSLAITDLDHLMDHVASAIKRVHGAATFTDNTAGEFLQDITIKKSGANTLTIGDASANDHKIVFDGNAVDFHMGLDDSADKLQIGLGSALGTTPNMTLNSGDRDVAFLGNIDVATVATAATFEPDGDTSAGDAAAIGYTASEGIIITGQGSNNDVTVKNDADATVLTIATGTTNVDVVGDLTAATLNADGDTSAGDNAAIGYTASSGIIITGQGSTADVTIKNDADQDVLVVPTGTQNVEIIGDLTVTGNDIKGSGGTAITMDGSNNVSLAADLTVAGGDILRGGAGAFNIATDAGANSITLGASNSTVVVAGNLDVNGTTTTVDTTNMTIEDRIIGLGVSGSNGNYSNLETGIVFGYGEKQAAQPSLSWNGAEFTFAKSPTSPASASFAAPSEYSSIWAGSILPGTAGSYDLGSTSKEWGDIFVADDKGVIFGSNQDVKLEYDEDGTDSLLISGGDVTLADDKKLYFGTNQDVSLEYDEDGLDVLSIAGGDVLLADDKKLYFGAAKDASIEYDEDGTDELRFAGAAVTFEQAVTFDGAVTLGNQTSDDVVVTGYVASHVIPKTDGAYDLGTSALGYNDLHLGSGGVINLDGGDVTLTHAAGKVTLGGDGAVEFDFANNEMTNVDIDSGAIDGAVIGAASAAAGTFTSLDCTDGAFAIANMDIDGGTDIGAALVDADLIIVDDGAGGTNRKCAMSRVATYLAPVKFVSVRSSVLAADTDLDTSLSGIDSAAEALVEVYVNGQLMTRGANAGANMDWYPGSSDGNIKFEFQLEVGDVVTAVLRKG